MVSRTTMVRLISYGIFATVSLALVILWFLKSPAGFRSAWIISYAIFFALFIVIQNRLPEGEGIRMFDASFIGLLVMTIFLLGSVALLIHIPFFIYVEPIVIYGCYFGLLLGLVIGYLAGKSYTRSQLELLERKNEFRGFGSSKLEVTILWGLTVFVLLGFLVVYLDLKALGWGLILFIISGTFALFVGRFFQVRAWQGNTGKIVWTTRKRFYIKYKNLPMDY
jgi:hypothetical protein